jgi:hypothetical protein
MGKNTNPASASPHVFSRPLTYAFAIPTDSQSCRLSNVAGDTWPAFFPSRVIRSLYYGLQSPPVAFRDKTPAAYLDKVLVQLLYINVCELLRTERRADSNSQPSFYSHPSPRLSPTPQFSQTIFSKLQHVYTDENFIRVRLPSQVNHRMLLPILYWHNQISFREGGRL